jgi:hypothetical protein
MGHGLESEPSEEMIMSKPFNARRHFAIKASIAKKAAVPNTVVLKNGVVVTITNDNEKFAETVRRNDAESAYEQAVLASLAA